MSTKDIETIAEFAARLARQEIKGRNVIIPGTGKVAEDVAALVRLSRGVHRLCEVACNRETTVREDKKKERSIQRAAAILAEYGYTLEVNNDPRGWPFILNAGPFGYRVPCVGC